MKSMHCFRRSGVLISILASSTVLSAAAISVQIPMPFDLLKVNTFDYKWLVTQSWDAVSGTWKDTVTTSHFTFGANNKPSECVTRAVDTVSKKLVNTLHSVFTYDGSDHVSTLTAFQWRTDSAKWNASSVATVTYTYANNLISQLNATASLLYVAGSLVPPQFRTVVANGKINAISFCNWDQNNKPLNDSLIAKISGVSSLLLGLMGLDTNYHNYLKDAYVRDLVSEVKTQSTWDTAAKAWAFSEKDSSILDAGGKKTITVISRFAGNAWNISGRDSLVYNGNGTLAYVYHLSWANNGWVNATRDNYQYTDQLGVEPFVMRNPATEPRIVAIHSTRSGAIIDFSLSRTAKVSFCLIDSRGCVKAASSPAGLTSGLHSLTVPGLSHGSYIIRLKMDDRQIATAFTVVR